MKIKKFHSDFKLNGRSFQSTDLLLDYAKNLDKEIFNFLKEWFDNQDYILVKTSGSTGNPKLIRLKKSAMIYSAKATGKFFSLKEKTSVLLVLSVNFIAGKMMLVRALELGWHIDLKEPTANPFKNLKKEYDFTAMVPLQLYNSINNLKWFKKIIVGGGVVLYKLIERIKNIPTEIYATYGMTETATHIAIKPLNNSAVKRLGYQDNFKFLPEIKFFTDDRGCLVVEAPLIQKDKIITNDLVEIISKTEFKWLGRVDNVINSGGIKLIPELIEEKIANIITQNIFIAGLPDEKLGEKVILFMEGHKNKIPVEEIERRLNKFEYPKKLCFLKKFDLTKNGKINRKQNLKKAIKQNQFFQFRV